MKIAVISPITFVPRLQNIAPEFENIEFTYLTYHQYQEIPKFMETEQDHFDAFLFPAFCPTMRRKNFSERI